MHLRLKTTAAMLAIVTGCWATNLKAQPTCNKRQENQLLRVVNKEGKVGFIDKSGKVVIGFDRWPKNVVTVGEFHEGLAPIWVDKPGEPHHTVPAGSATPVGYVNESGRIAIEPRFDYAYEFCGGLALVQKDQVSAYINHRGEMVVDLTRDCSEQTTTQKRSAHRTRTLVDRCGPRAVKGMANKRAEPFSEGLAAVADFGYGPKVRYGFINREGTMVIPPKFEPELEHHGFIRGMSHFSDGLAKVKVNGRYGYINKKGELVIPAEFDSADDFSEGLAYVWSNSKSGYIDHKGRLVIAARADWNTGRYAGGKFSEGLAAVHCKTGWFGYIDRTGAVVIPPRFDSAEEFVNGVARIYEEARQGQNWETAFGYIDKRGKYIWRPGLGNVLR